MAWRYYTYFYLALVVISLILCTANDVDNITGDMHRKAVKTVVASLMSIFLPINLGFMILSPLTRRMSQHAPPVLMLASFWSVGLLLIWLLATGVAVPLGLGLRWMAVLLALVSLLSLRRPGLDFTVRGLLMAVSRSRRLQLALSLSIIPIVYMKIRSPFPYMISYDQLYYSGIALRYMDGKLPFNWYPGYHSLVGTVCALVSLNPVFLYWTAPFLVVPVFVLGLFTMVHRAFEDEYAALAASLMAPWFNGWGWASDPYTFAPRTFLYLLLPYLVLSVVEVSKERKARLVDRALLPVYAVLPVVSYFVMEALGRHPHATLLAWLVPVAPSLALTLVVRSPLPLPSLLLILSAFPLHTLESAALSLPLVLVSVICFLHAKSPRVSSLLVYLVASLFMLYFYSQWLGVENPVLDAIKAVGDTPAAILVELTYPFHYEFKDQLMLLVQSYMPLTLILCLAGAAYSVRESGSACVPALLLALVGTLYVYFLPWPYGRRLINYLTTLITPFAALAITSFIRASGARWLRLLLTALITALMALSLPLSYYMYIEYFRMRGYTYRGWVTHFTEGDLKAAEWLRARARDYDVVVCDPMTMRILEGVSGREFSGVGYDAARRLLMDYDYARALKVAGRSRNVFFVINGRTYRWMLERPKESVPPYPPGSLVVFPGLRRLLASNRTVEIYRYRDEAVIVRLKRGVRQVVKDAGTLVVDVGGRFIEARARVKYYEPHDAICEVELTGYRRYDIKDFPRSWVFKEVLVNGKRRAPAPGSDPDARIVVSGVKPGDKVVVRWYTNLLYDACWRSSNMGAWRREVKGRVVTLRMGGLNVVSDRCPVLIVSARGTENAAYRVFLRLDDGTLISPFPAPVKLSGVDVELAINYGRMLRGRRVTEVVVTAWPIRGEKFDFRVNYVMLARPAGS